MAHHVVTDFGALVVESLCDLECTLRTASRLAAVGGGEFLARAEQDALDLQTD
jgi:hypothetical protein